MIDIIKLVADATDVNSLRELRTLLDELIAGADGGEAMAEGTMQLVHSVDKAFATMGSVVVYSAIVANKTALPFKEAVLIPKLPKGMKYIPESLSVGFVPDIMGESRLPEMIEIGALAAETSVVVRFAAVVEGGCNQNLREKNPLRINASAKCITESGRVEEIGARELKIWATDRTCIAEHKGCDMAQVLAQWTLTQLFGLPEAEIGSLLIYLQDNKDDILSGFYAR